MKRLLFLISFILVTMGAFAQKYAYVDTEYILKNIPAYTLDLQQLDKLSQQYQQELETMHGKLQKMYSDFQSEAALLSSDMKQKREDLIVSEEQKYRNLQKTYFGPKGNLVQKREQLMQPLQDDIRAAVRQIAATGSYAVIFDKAAGAALLYTNPRFDLSDQVLQKLGYKN